MVRSLRASAQGLEIVNKARKKKGWTKTMTLAWAEAVPTSNATLKRFWRQLPIQEETFIKICQAVGIENWKDIISPIPDDADETAEIPTQSWGEAPDISGYFGRGEELLQLERWIVAERCRLVGILGMGGIGKTALTAMFCDSIQDQFTYLYWRSLRSAPLLSDILTDLLEFFCIQPQTNVAPIKQLVDCLQAQQCLLVLDDFDAVLGGGDRTGYYLEGYEGYGELLKQMAEVSTKSCVILISREKPREIASREGKTIRCLEITGLKAIDAREILNEKGLSDLDYWEELIQLYRGNPLALKVVSTTIKELFDGKVSEFLKQNTIVVKDEIKDLLDRQFQRLSQIEKEVMYWLAINPEAVHLSQLPKDIFLTETTSILLEALASLGRRCLIEKTTAESRVLFTLQPLVRKHVTNIFVKQLCSEIYEGKITLLYSHPLFQIKHPEQDNQREFTSRPVLTLVKNRLIKILGNDSSMLEHIKQIITRLEEKSSREIGYAKDNLLSLLKHINTI